MTKALIVVTSTAQFDHRMQATGVWLSEATHFHAVMKEHGIAVDYVSPEGGYVPLDPGSLLPENLDPTSWELYSDNHYRQHYLAEALQPSAVQPDDYDLIYFAGGHGTMWDFPGNNELAAIAQQIYANGGLVTAVCHGVVGLLPMRESDGTAFIKGRKLTGFTNEEEAINKLSDAMRCHSWPRTPCVMPAATTARPHLTQNTWLSTGASLPARTRNPHGALRSRPSRS